MEGHHLILGKVTDYLTGESIVDTHDERYRQKIAALLVEQKGFEKKDIRPRYELLAQAGEKQALVRIDFLVSIAERIGMIIKYGPGSVLTRHRPTLAASRLVAPYQVPLAVVTNGEDADIVDGATGKLLAQGLDAIPSKPALQSQMTRFEFRMIGPERREMESRIFYVFEVDGACPCDDTICRLA